MASLMLLTTIPIQAKAELKNPITATAPAKSPEVEVLLSRLNEINAMDKSTMSKPEKKQLRKEVRSIKRNLNELSGGGVYVSVGAIIIILLLLIILL